MFFHPIRKKLIKLQLCWFGEKEGCFLSKKESKEVLVLGPEPEYVVCRLRQSVGIWSMRSTWNLSSNLGAPKVPYGFFNKIWYLKSWIFTHEHHFLYAVWLGHKLSGNLRPYQVLYLFNIFFRRVPGELLVIHSASPTQSYWNLPRYVVVTLEAVHQLTQVARQIDFEARAMLPNTHTLLYTRRFLGGKEGGGHKKNIEEQQNMVTICHNKSKLHTSHGEPTNA